MNIPTVTGDISPNDLGITLAHEHVTLELTSRFPEDHYLHPYTLPGPDAMIPEVQEFVKAGGSTLVSLTNESMGRDIAALKQVAEGAGVNIVAATGYYVRESAPAIEDAKALGDHFIKELTVGIDDTGVRAGVIGELGTGASMPGDFEFRLFEAAARASLETGAPIAGHTHGGQLARWQVQYLTRLGVPADRIAICHLDETLAVRDNRPTDLELAIEIADSGSYVSVDSIGMSYYGEWLSRPEPSDHDRAWLLAKLVERGYADHVLLGHDIACDKDLLQNGGPGYGHILNNFLGKLQQFGVDRQTAHRFLVDNPRRWLAGRPI
ncbi:phosphotriesterase [Micromonospora sp. NPDC048830]|uniref:phosphotriesterase family protein n=1 Tax=Micromonospora sp. NPDC048830 TaxID=3364257 RepID=UPI003713E187